MGLINEAYKIMQLERLYTRVKEWLDRPEVKEKFNKFLGTWINDANERNDAAVDFKEQMEKHADEFANRDVAQDNVYTDTSKCYLGVASELNNIVSNMQDDGSNPGIAYAKSMISLSGLVNEYPKEAGFELLNYERNKFAYMQNIGNLIDASQKENFAITEEMLTDCYKQSVKDKASNIVSDKANGAIDKINEMRTENEATAENKGLHEFDEPSPKTWINNKGVDEFAEKSDTEEQMNNKGYGEFDTSNLLPAETQMVSEAEDMASFE